MALGVWGGCARHVAPVDALMQVDSVTYSMAQQVRWLDDTHVLVGRWDGTIGVFSAPVEDGARAILETSLVLPGATGVQLLVPRTSHESVSSGGPDHLWMWRADAGADRTDFVPHELSFPVEAGVAVSGLFTRIGEQELLVTGHENGALLVWEWEESGFLDCGRRSTCAWPSPSTTRMPTSRCATSGASRCGAMASLWRGAKMVDCTRCGSRMGPFSPAALQSRSAAGNQRPRRTRRPCPGRQLRDRQARPEPLALFAPGRPNRARRRGEPPPG